MVQPSVSALRDLAFFLRVKQEFPAPPGFFWDLIVRAPPPQSLEAKADKPQGGCDAEKLHFR
jgi:hypothetical protein